jgi:hypothetical protein
LRSEEVDSDLWSRISDMLLFLRMVFLFKLTRELDFDNDTLDGPVLLADMLRFPD